MMIGIGLPTHTAAAVASRVGDWTRRAEHRGFESVATIDRLLYPGWDGLVALTLAAEASDTVTLVTNVLLAPMYPTAIVAKQLATLAAASDNRLTVGVAVGARHDDYVVAEADFEERGHRFDRQLPALRRVWEGLPLDGDTTALVPAPVRIPLLMGGTSAATIRRVATIGDGWAAGALRDYPGQSAFAARVRAEWSRSGRLGAPLLQASVNFALGAESDVDAGRDYLAEYYGFAPAYAALNVADLVTSSDGARATVEAYRGMGFDRVVFHPTLSDGVQVDRLADAVF